MPFKKRILKSDNLLLFTDNIVELQSREI